MNIHLYISNVMLLISPTHVNYHGNDVPKLKTLTGFLFACLLGLPQKW